MPQFFTGFIGFELDGLISLQLAIVSIQFNDLNNLLFPLFVKKIFNSSFLSAPTGLVVLETYYIFATLCMDSLRGL